MAARSTSRPARSRRRQRSSFNVTGITREKEYDLTRGNEKSKVHYFTANANGEAEVVSIALSPNCTARHKSLDFYFEELEIKGRGAMGNQLTKYPIKTVKFKEAGKSTLSAVKLWFDDKFGRLNTESKGIYLGNFDGSEKLLVVFNDGNYELTDLELTQRFDPEKILLLEKFNPDKVITAVYLDNEKLQFNVKRFRIETSTLQNKFLFIKEGNGNRLEIVSTLDKPVLLLHTGRGAQARTQKIKLADFVEVMGWKAVGNKLADFSKSTEMEWEQKEKEDGPQASLFG